MSDYQNDGMCNCCKKRPSGAGDICDHCRKILDEPPEEALDAGYERTDGTEL